jgi:hypothetical protein
MQMSPVGLSFGRQAIIHLRNRDKFPGDREKAENFAKIYIPDNPVLSYDGSSVIVTPKNQNINKETFLREDAAYLNRMIGEGLDVTYTTKECDFDSKGNPYFA